MRRWGSLVSWVALTGIFALLTPGDTVGQVKHREIRYSSTAVYVGGALQSWDGHFAGAGFATVATTVDISRRWTFRAEAGQTTEVCSDGRCEAYPIVHLSLVRFFDEFDRRAFLVFGLLPHVGIGREIPLIQWLVLRPEIDLEWVYGSLSFQAKLGIALLR